MNFKFYKKNKLASALRVLASFAILLASVNVYGQTNNNEKINTGLIYPLSSNGSNAPNDTNKFSLNLIAGVSAAEHGFTIAGIANVIHDDARGLQIAGFLNDIGKKADGTMFAGFMNTYGSGNGFAVAGFTNIAKANSGMQVAGFMNKAGSVSSVQVAGFANFAGDVKGTQVAGFINIAKKVTGTQISGFINIADSANCQVGLINLSKNGEKSLGVTVDENETTLLAFRSGGKVLYGVIGIGYNFKNKREIYAYEAGFGAHVFKAGIFSLNTELTQSSLESFKRDEYFKSSVKLLPAIKIAHVIELFAGPSLNYVTTNNEEGETLTKNYISSWGNTDNHDFHGFYLGYTAGVQVYF